MLNIKTFQVNPLQENCYVVSDDTHACVIIDCGAFYDSERQAITEYISYKNLTPIHLLCTHGHFDHVWGVDKLLGHFSVPVYMHPADKEILADGTSVFKGMQKFKIFQHSIATTDIADGEVLTSAGTDWKVIHTPGHTPGGVCYFSADNSLLLSGDTLFAGSIGRTDLGGGDYDVLMQSIQQKLLTLPGDTDVIPGHGHPTSIAQEGMHNPFLQPFNEPEGDSPEEGIVIDGI